MRLEVFKGDSGQWFIRLVGGNQEKMMISESYDNKQNAIRAADRIREVWEATDTIQVKVIE
jgi:uncharacterized protein YegP (UPF0339 family)